MAFDESLAERIRQRLGRRKGVEEKKMFGGVGFGCSGGGSCTPAIIGLRCRLGCVWPGMSQSRRSTARLAT